MQDSWSCRGQPSNLLRRTRSLLQSVRACICQGAGGAFAGYSSVCGTCRTCCTDTVPESPRKSMQIDTESQLADDKSTFTVFQPLKTPDTEKDKAFPVFEEL